MSIPLAAPAEGVDEGRDGRILALAIGGVTSTYTDVSVSTTTATVFTTCAHTVTASACGRWGPLQGAQGAQGAGHSWRRGWTKDLLIIQFYPLINKLYDQTYNKCPSGNTSADVCLIIAYPIPG